MKKQEKIKSRDLKKEKVKDLAEKVSRAKTLVFADYRGLTVNQISGIRQKVKESGGEMIVAKNTLVTRALSIHHLPFTISQIAGPTATIIAYEDEISPIKAVADSAKTLGIPKFKFGFFGKVYLDQEAVDSLAKIPPKEVLYAKVVGTLSSPIYGIVSVLQANIRNLVSILDQVSKKSPVKVESEVN